MEMAGEEEVIRWGEVQGLEAWEEVQEEHELSGVGLEGSTDVEP